MFRQGSASGFQQARLLTRLHGIRGLRERLPGFDLNKNQRLRVRDDKVNFTGFSAQPPRQHRITLRPPDRGHRVFSNTATRLGQTALN